MFEKILVAIDRSPVSEQAFHQAIELAKRIDGQLMLIHVQDAHEETYPNPVLPTDSNYPLMQAEMLQTHLQEWAVLEQQGLELLQSHADQAKAAGVATEFTQSFGNPGQTICALARSWGAKLIVVGRQEQSRLEEMLMGSVSHSVLHHAPCSVLVVHDQETAPESSDTP